MLNKFIAWFESDSPNFIGNYGSVLGFYDKKTDTFQIEEIQTAYEEMKNGDKPNSLYFSWRHV